MKHGNITYSTESDVVLSANKTVNLTSGMSAAEIQALIDAQPKNLGGYSLIFQFGDGTYTLTAQLNFQDFYSGNLLIYGNTAEANATALHTTQSVVLDFSSGGLHGINVDACACYVFVRNFNIKIADNASKACVHSRDSLSSDIRFSYFRGAGKTATCSGVYARFGTPYIEKNYVDNLYRGVTIETALAISANNDDTGTAPNYGLWSQNGAVLGKGGTQPAGTTSAEGITNGGTIN